MFGFGKKNKLGLLAVENSKKEAYFLAPSRPRVDGIFRKETFIKEEIKIEIEKDTIEEKKDNKKITHTTSHLHLDRISTKEGFIIENKIDNKKKISTPRPLRVDGIFRKEKQIAVEEELEEEEGVDNNKRSFLKVAGATGLGLAAVTLLPKSASAYVTGSTPTSNVVGIKNSSNTRINPATEETLDEVLKTTDLTFDAGSLQVKVTSMPAGTSSFSDSGDVAKSALVDIDRHVQVDVLSSTLPVSASTETTLQTIAFGGTKYALRLVTVGSIDYMGEAAIGSLTSSAVWRVKKIDSTTGISITWAGTGIFNQIWDNYASLTYT